MGRRPRKPHHAPPFLPAYAQCGGEQTLPIPGYRQARNYSCGFATALMVARYYLPEIDARELYGRLGTSRDGTRQNAIVKALRTCGLAVNVRYDVGFERLAQEIGRGKLVIGYLHDAEHWVLLYGYGLTPQRVFVADPEPGEACVQPWERYGVRLRDFGIVCSSRRRAQSPAPASTAQALPAPPASAPPASAPPASAPPASAPPASAPIDLAERRAARERDGEPAKRADTAPGQLSFGFMRRGR